MSETIQENDIEGVLDTILSGTDEEVLVINPSTDAITSLVTVLDRLPHPPPVVVVADRSALREAFEDFLFASVAADLVAEESLTLRTAEGLPRGSLAVTAETVVSIVTAGGQAAGLATEDASFVESATGQYRTLGEESTEFTLRTPPLSEIRRTLGEELGDEQRAAFDAIVRSVETARGDSDGIDEVTISLLVAARGEEMLYDISKWGEDIGLASKATFSRTKTALEDEGIITSEKVPIDIGRPRLRLLLTEEFAGLDAGELATRVAERMADVDR